MSSFCYTPRNLRDLGGHRGRFGTIRTGLLYRSAHLDDLGAKDIRRLRRLGLTLALDFRDASERQRTIIRPDVCLSRLSLRHMPLLDTMTPERMAVIVAELRALRSAKAARDWMTGQYEDTVLRCKPRVVSAVSTLMTHEAPSVFFCAAGKDRTGVIAALLLLALGISQDVVLKDYLKTNRTLLGIWRRRSRSARQQYDLSGVSNRVIDALADAHPNFLAAVFAAIEKAGGIDNYMCQENGVSLSTVERFRQRMIAG
jgi:protein-tyrosine phosphatase